jgi:ribosomal protein S18 acetylase RimI-like enzyme
MIYQQACSPGACFAPFQRAAALATPPLENWSGTYQHGRRSVPEYTLHTYDADGAKKLLDSVVIPVYEDVYAEEIKDDPFYSVERFLGRFRSYVAAPGFALCVARVESDETLGYMFGYSLGPGARWWNGLLSKVPEGFTREDGQRTWAVNEIMVLKKARRLGIATALHNELLSRRKESRATLLVDPENAPAKAAYKSWGWTAVGNLQPFPDSPKYLSMIRSLPL